MAGTRTSGAIDGTPNYKTVSVALLDYSGDVRSVSVRVPDAATNAQIEAYVAALQAATQASIYKVEVQYTYEGALDTDNAQSDEESSVFDNVSIGFRDLVTGAAQTGYIPAPIPDIVVTGDEVDTEQAQYVALRDALDTLLAGNYAPRYTRYTERREINKRKPAGSA